MAPRLPHPLRIDRLIAELGARHNGLVPTAALYSAGHCHEAVRNRLDAKLLNPVLLGVHSLSNVTITPEIRALAAALVSPNSWVSHTSALALHGATLRSSQRVAEISSPHQYRQPQVRAHRHPLQSTVNVGYLWDIAVSRPWWAVIESAAVLPEDDLAVAMDSLLQLKLTSLARLERAHLQTGWYRGSRTLARLINDRVNGAGLVRSFLEQDLSRLLKRQQLPQPIRNFELRLPDGRRRIIDSAWPERRIGLEAHSWKHHSNPSQWGSTMTRDRRLSSLGWTMLPVVVADTREPTALLADLRRLFTQSR
jgi:hypothetical protein